MSCLSTLIHMSVHHLASKRQSWNFDPGIWLCLLILFSKETERVVLSQLCIFPLSTKSRLHFKEEEENVLVCWLGNYGEPVVE